MKYKIVFFFSKSKEKIAKELRGILDQQGWEEVDSDSAEFVFVIGGDGSFFHFVKEYAFQNKKVVGIRGGNTSFALDLQLKDLGGLGRRSWKNLVILKVEHGEESHFAINDIYVSGRLFLDTDMYIDDIFLERFRGSGVLFSTKCGSTGMNKSIGGPILMDDELWLFNEVGTCNTSGNRSLVVPVILSSHNSIQMQLRKSRNCHLYVDGKKVKCYGKKKLQISMIKGQAKVLEMDMNDYISKIRNIFLV